MPPISTAFDALFDKYRGRVPKAYLRALAFKESAMDPRAHIPPGGRGLMQITGIVRQDFNQRHKTSITADQLLDAEISIRIAGDLLNRIVAAYGKHPSPNMREDWTNPEFVKLVTQGWNAGYSEGGGVGKVATYLEKRGLPVTHDTVRQYHQQAGGVAKLGNPTAHAWQRGVAALYQQQPDWKAGGMATTLLMILGLGFAAVKLKLFS